MSVYDVRPARLNYQCTVSEAEPDLIEDDIADAGLTLRNLASKLRHPPDISFFFLVKKELCWIIIKLEGLYQASFSEYAFQEGCAVYTRALDFPMVVERSPDETPRDCIDARTLIRCHVFPISASASEIAEAHMRAAAACILFAFPSCACGARSTSCFPFDATLAVIRATAA